jgi:hypothetical protein
LNLQNMTLPKRVSLYVRADEAFSVAVCSSRSGSQAIQNLSAGKVLLRRVPRLAARTWGGGGEGVVWIVYGRPRLQGPRGEQHELL